MFAKYENCLQVLVVKKWHNQNNTIAVNLNNVHDVKNRHLLLNAVDSHLSTYSRQVVYIFHYSVLEKIDVKKFYKNVFISENITCRN